MGTAKRHFELSDLLSTRHNKPHLKHISSKYLFLTNIFTTIIAPLSCPTVNSDCATEQHVQFQLFKEFHIQMNSHVSCYIILTVSHKELTEGLHEKH